MNIIKKLQLALVIVFATGIGALHAQTFNWGSAVFSDLVDSEGNTLDNTYVFEVGSFEEGFVPDETNTDQWFANWRVFDAAAYNGVEETDDDGIYGYFTSTANMNPDGTSDSTWRTSSTMDFTGLDAYIWVRNSDVAEPGSEWMLTRADAWVFPAANTGCCGNEAPIEWSTSDLTTSDTPVWGTQGGVTGGGVVTSTGTYTLQTATFVPEPSALLLSMLAATLFISLRRRR